jgi:hypothetical protein
MQRFNFLVTFRQCGELLTRKYTIHTKDIGIATAWVHATTSINGLDVIEIVDINN